LNPLPKQLGQKYGRQFPAIRQVLLELDPEQASRLLLEGKPLPLELDSNRFEILPEEVEVRVQARSGFAVASEGAYLAALVTDLTPELVQEGLAREFVRRVQDLRKQADLNISDRIQLYYTATPGMKQALQSFRDYIQGETLTVAWTEGSIPSGMASTTDEFDGEKVTIALSPAGH
jgi:isoleucyl-tRNA synthetase